MAQHNFKMALCEGRHEIKGAVRGFGCVGK